jgi:hypothetical protein
MGDVLVQRVLDEGEKRLKAREHAKALHWTYH